MTDKKLSRSMEILEVVIQMITFYSAFMAVYFGALCFRSHSFCCYAAERCGYYRV